MRNRKFGQTLRRHMKENTSLYLFTIVLFTMGVGFGAVIVNSLDPSQRQDLTVYLSQFFQEFKQGPGGSSNPQTAFRESLGHYIKYMGIMWALGLSIIGLPAILIMIFLKGLVVGFTVGFFVGQWSWNGVLMAGLSVLPQNLLVIPAVIIVGTSGVSFSLRLIRSRFIRQGEPISTHFFSYSALVLLTGVVLTAASLFEAFISPVLMKHILAAAAALLYP